VTFRLTPPPAVLAPLVREAPTRLDPFRLDGPALVSFSGGRTSAYMLRRILDACGGRLPAGVHAVFANTGRERPETLDFVRECAERWGVRVVWVERRGRLSGAAGSTWAEVNPETSSRNGEPFAELIREKQFPPSRVMRFCTTDLKIKVARDYMFSLGYNYWTNAVGLRRDETKRVMSATAHSEKEPWDIVCPLYDARITKADVAAFWNAQPFDLALQAHEGNCDLCFLKGRRKRERIMRERPDLVGWWADMETFVKGRFHAHEPGYAATLERVRRLPMLPMDIDGEDDGIPCTCTD
jgi:3'-phosphoadenosine 5'-phosphosulfate sulfotransferase (PAPS reductase)/FAD synthetase